MDGSTDGLREGLAACDSTRCSGVKPHLIARHANLSMPTIAIRDSLGETRFTLSINQSINQTYP